MCFFVVCSGCIWNMGGGSRSIEVISPLLRRVEGVRSALEYYPVSSGMWRWFEVHRGIIPVAQGCMGVRSVLEYYPHCSEWEKGCVCRSIYGVCNLQLHMNGDCA